MAASDLEKALQTAKVECATLAEQLRQARVDLHRLGADDMNRTLIASSISSALGLVVGLAVGVRMNRKAR